METAKPEDVSDEALMLRIRSGDQGAFAELVRRYETSLFNYLRRVLGNSTEAEDVYQEAFLRVYQHRASFRADGRFRPWLYRIATNLCRDRQRFWWRRPTVSLAPVKAENGSLPLDTLASTAPKPDDEAIAEEVREGLEAAIQALPIRQRTVFLMARYEGMSYDDISQVLSIPVGTVKSRMNKATHLLAESLRRFRP